MKKWGQDLRKTEFIKDGNRSPISWGIPLTRGVRTFLAILIYIFSFGVLFLVLVYGKTDEEKRLEANQIKIEDPQAVPDLSKPTKEELIMRRWDKL